VLASSSTYETAPVGDVLDQPAFLNACLRCATALEPEALLDACKAIEAARGRVLAGEPGYVRHGPRPLDVDVLLLDGPPVATPRLTVPHPALHERRFVLIPLLELDLGLRTPDGRALADSLALLPLDEEVRLAGPSLKVPEHGSDDLG
jgi:2-amino-4-hydroxy-6-hydroxymethyldihydropteridine diphosphokinase